MAREARQVGAPWPHKGALSSKAVGEYCDTLNPPSRQFRCSDISEVASSHAVRCCSNELIRSIRTAAQSASAASRDSWEYSQTTWSAPGRRLVAQSTAQPRAWRRAAVTVAGAVIQVQIFLFFSTGRVPPRRTHHMPSWPATD